MADHDAAERAYVQAVLDARAAQIADARASMQAELDHLRESWSSGTDLDGHQDRLQAMRDETRAWITENFLADVADGEPVQGQGRQGVSGAEPATASSAPGPGQQSLTADDIKAMSMQEYAARRSDLGVRSATSMDRLFGQETRR